MSKVELSIQEYNELYDKIMFLEGIINKLVTPMYDSWDLDYFKNDDDRSITLRSDLSFNSSEFNYLKSRFYSNLQDAYKELKDVSLDFNFISKNVYIATLEHLKSEQQVTIDTTEEEEPNCCDAMND